MTTETLDSAAREAVASACARVDEPQDSDTVDGVRPGLVARPADTDQVSEVMRASAAHGLTVVPRGRGTKLSWGTAPTSADVLLDLSALDRVLDHAAGDLIVATQAGALLADVQRTVAEGGQRLALDETVPGSTIGGLLGANTSGPRRTATGTARDLLIGITLVRADGVVAKAGGRVVKNVAGYDLGKLLIGSGGTLAVITDATFRLHPLPAAHRWIVVPVDSPARALAVAQSVVHAQVVPAAVEVEWAAGAGTLSVLVEGRADGVAGRADAVRTLLGPDATESGERAGGRGDVPLGRDGHRRPAQHRPQAHLRALGPGRRPRGRRRHRRHRARICRLRGALRRPRARHAPRRRAYGAGTAAAGLHRPRRHCRRRRRARRGEGGRRRVGTDPRARPDAPRQGPVRP